MEEGFEGCSWVWGLEGIVDDWFLYVLSSGLRGLAFFLLDDWCSRLVCFALNFGSCRRRC